MSAVTRRVIFADIATVKYNTVVSALEAQKVIAETTTLVPDLIARLATEKYDICVVNLLLGGVGPFELIENLRKSSSNPELKIIVVTRQVHKLNIQNSMRAGANDFIAEPFEAGNLTSRILYHLGPVRVIETSGYSESIPGGKDAELVRLMLESGEVLACTPRDKMHEGIFSVLQKLATCINSNRTSLIVVDESVLTGVVLASSDDANFYNFPVTLEKYPEVLHVMNSTKPIFVEDVSQNPLTQSIKQSVKSIAIGSLVVFPVWYQNEIVGVMHVRRSATKDLPSKEAMRTLQVIANLMAAHANVAVLLRRIYKGFKSAA